MHHANTYIKTDGYFLHTVSKTVSIMNKRFLKADATKIIVLYLVQRLLSQ